MFCGLCVEELILLSNALCFCIAKDLTGEEAEFLGHLLQQIGSTLCTIGCARELGF